MPDYQKLDDESSNGAAGETVFTSSKVVSAVTKTAKSFFGGLIAGSTALAPEGSALSEASNATNTDVTGQSATRR
jgi:hypothetical protein